MADGWRVTAKCFVGGREYRIETSVTVAQMADPVTRNKIRRYLRHQLVDGIIEELGGVDFEAVRSLEVSGFQPDSVVTGQVRETEVKPPTAP